MNIQDYCLSDNQFVLYGILEGSGYVGKQPPVRGKKLKKNANIAKLSVGVLHSDLNGRLATPAGQCNGFVK